MTVPTGKDERRKDMKEFFNFMVFPFSLAVINSAFFKMAMVSLTGLPGSQKYLVHVSSAGWLGSDFGFSFALMICLVYLWGRPAYLYVRQPTEQLKEILRRRIGNVYRDALLMLVLVQAAAFAMLSVTPGLVSRAELAAAGVSFFAQAAMLVVYIDYHLSGQKNLMQALYSAEELSRPKGGFSIPVYIKLSMLIIGFAIIPFLLVGIAASKQVPWEQLNPYLIWMLFISGIVLLHGINNVYCGIQKPLDGLIGRMKNVAGGDYSKTRIYFSDEVAALKTGFNEMVDGLREREELQDTFGKYLSIEIARELLNNKKVNLGGEDMEAAVMFCDIRNFTPLSEKLSAAGLVEFLNNYFRYVTPAITAHNGVINKFIGDAVMAIYTPMLGSHNFALDAVRSAVEMRTALAEYNASGGAPGRVEFGIGIHSGRLVGGNIGTLSRLEFTFIGDTVNIASRLESKTKDLDTDILVSQPVLGGLGADRAGFSFESVGRVALKGKAEPMELYKVL
ncbi:MAG TPA: adenylate/guanylate cyclase domain-containing protein [Elusimicrobiales bacterium]|nr:adenylate/guanylate cyclase domain-containing protein [Elusimicrobiales bacterium]